MKLYEAFAEALKREGTQILFTLVDDTILPLVQAASEAGIRIVATRHEQAAVAMADGYSRAGGFPAVAVVGAGPALAQTATALVTAARHRSRILVLAGQTPEAMAHHVKRFDQAGFVAATGCGVDTVRDDEDASATFYRALRRAGSGTGPTVLCLPADLLERQVVEPFHDPAEVAAAPPAPDEADLARAASMIEAARRPIIVAGAGALQSGAMDGIQALAARSGALLATTLQAREWFRGCAGDIGLMGSLATPSARALFGRADLLVAVGTTLNPYVLGTAFGDALLGAETQLLQIDRDPARIGRDRAVTQAIVGDAGGCVEALLRRLGPGDKPLWVEALPQPSEPSPPPRGGRPSAREFLAALAPMLPTERSVTVDCGLFTFAVVDEIRCRPEQFHWTLDFGSVGLALPLGLGAAMARPELPAFVFVGDGGLAMSVHELMTAAAQGVAVTIVVLDDGGFGAEAHILEERGKPAGLADYPNPDFHEVARSLGVEAARVESLAELETHRGRLGRPEAGPFLLHARVVRDPGHRSVAPEPRRGAGGPSDLPAADGAKAPLRAARPR